MDKIFYTYRIPDEGMLLLKNYEISGNNEDRFLSKEEIIKGARDASALISLLSDRIDSEVISSLPKLKVIANYAVGYNNIDVAAATARGIMVTNTPGVLTDATADHAWALLFSVARRIVEGDAFMRAGKFEGWGPMMFLGGDITGKTLGIVGAGRIGAAMALKSRGFGMRVLYADVARNEELESDLGAQWVDLDTLLAESDFVSLHVALTPETVHLINAERLGKMKPTAYLINTSRGPVIHEAELVEALRRNVIAGAALDVYEFEPKMVPGLAELTNVVLAPHTASATRSSRSGMSIKAATNLLAMLRGERPPDCLNPEIYG